MQRIILIYILLLTTTFVFGQDVMTKKQVSGKAKNLYERALLYSGDGKYDKAISDIEKVISIEPSFIDAHIQYGAILYDLKKYAEAETRFEKAIELKADYKPNVYYMLAITEAKQNKYEESVEHLEAYLASDHKSSRQRTRATEKIKQYTFTANAMKNPVPFDPKSLGDMVNSDWPEYLPALTADGETLIYTRRVRGQEDFYVSEKKDSSWSLGIPLTDINDPINNEGAQSISADGRFLVFTACNRRDGYGQCDLYYSEVRDGRWTKPTNIKAPINTRAWDSQPSVSADGNTIYFSSNRDGVIGGNDIWVSSRDSNGKWQQPTNLGDKVNTKGDEQSPFIHPDGQTLYFMSDGHPGMGKTDLYLSRKQADGTWGEAINLGYPINTASHEGALIVSLDGKTAYFASDRDFGEQEAYEQKNKVNQTDLYSFELYPAARPQPVTYVKAKVSDAITGQQLIADVALVDLGLQKTHTSSTTDQDGTFLVCLPVGKNYGLNVNKKGYLFHSENFALDVNNTFDKPYILDIKLQRIMEQEIVDIPDATTAEPVSSSKPIILKNIFFETGSAELQTTSFAELNQLKSLLMEYPNIRIQINGHTDNVGNSVDNLQLANNRAQSVQKWLIENGIDASRLIAKGFGETMPIDSNDTEEGRQNNRRTEFMVL